MPKSKHRCTVSNRILKECTIMETYTPGTP
jgi:hypothetical protein